MTGSRGVAGWADTAAYDFETDPQTDIINLPDVTGWRLLVLPIHAKRKSDGGVLIPEVVTDKEEQVITIGKVLQVGELAYHRADMLVNGKVKPWCKVDDLVLFGKYNGMRIVFQGVAVRILSDDEIIAVVPKEVDKK